MMELFAERGGDPDRPGKRNPLDPLMWLAARPDEPAWETALGHGRPGWHIECVAIALDTLGMSFDVQGGGSDLIFPHHEMGAAHAESTTAEWPYARHYVHAGQMSALAAGGRPLEAATLTAPMMCGRRFGTDFPTISTLSLRSASWTDGHPPPTAVARDRRTMAPGSMRLLERCSGSACCHDRPGQLGGVGVSSPSQVSLEFSRNGFTTGLGEIGSIASLLQLSHVIRHFLILACHLVHPEFPRPGILGEVPQGDWNVKQVFHTTHECQGGLR
jgi:hypothetical protein